MAERDVEALGWLDELANALREIHDDVLSASGGLQGEHAEKLQAACARPFQTAFGEFIFSTDVEKAAALFHGIITSHAFADGNKRTATMAVILALEGTGFAEPTSELQVRLLGELAVATASGGVTVEDVAFWLERIFLPRTEAAKS